MEDDNFEVAPSSPENHLPHRHPQHHHHHKRHHHHHDNHLSRPKLSNSLRKEVENYDHIFTSLQDILRALDEHRKETGKKFALSNPGPGFFGGFVERKISNDCQNFREKLHWVKRKVAT